MSLIIFWLLLMKPPNIDIGTLEIFSEKKHFVIFPELLLSCNGWQYSLYTIYFSEGMWRKHYEDIGYLDKDSRQITAKKLYQETNWNSTSNNISWNDWSTVSDSNQKFPHDFMVVFVNALEPICFKKFNFSEILTNYITKIVWLHF